MTGELESAREVSTPVSPCQAHPWDCKTVGPGFQPPSDLRVHPRPRCAPGGRLSPAGRAAGSTFGVLGLREPVFREPLLAHEAQIRRTTPSVRPDGDGDGGCQHRQADDNPNGVKHRAPSLSYRGLAWGEHPGWPATRAQKHDSAPGPPGRRSRPHVGSALMRSGTEYPRCPETACSKPHSVPDGMVLLPPCTKRDRRTSLPRLRWQEE